jgi:integrase
MRVKKLYDGKPYKLAVNREGYYELRWTGADGKTKQRSTAERDLDQARATAEVIWRDINQIILDSTRPTIVTLAERYLLNCDTRQTTKGQHNALKPVLAVFGHRSDHPLSATDLETYIAGRRRQVKDATIRRELAGLRATLRFGVKRGLITAGELPTFELPSSSPPRNNPATVEEVSDLWALALAASPPEGQGDLKPITLFACVSIATGARRGAVLELPWGQIDWNGPDSRIMLNFGSDRPSANRNKRRSHIPAPKMLEPVLRRAFREALDRAGLVPRAGAREALPLKTPEILRTLRVCGVKSIRDQWENLVKKSKKPNLNIHDLRHTWATNHIRAGVDPVEVALWLQDDLKTIMATYVHLKPGFLVNAADKLDVSTS